MIIKIIIADDHQLFIDGIKSILSSEIGISIIGEALNGRYLLHLVQKVDHVDLILTDIRMPVMNGITATRELLKFNPSLLILALSMYDQPRDVIQMMNAGARGYLMKNANKAEMINAIYTMVQKKEYFSPALKDLIKKIRLDQEISPSSLTRREKDIVQLIGRGRTSLQIAQELNISKLTVDTHRKNILKKLNITTVAALIRYAMEQEQKEQRQ